MQTTNEDLDQLWAEAEAKEDTKTLTLIELIDKHKAAYGKESSRHQKHKRKTTELFVRTRLRAFRQGQSYMRLKIAQALESAGYEDAAAVASRVFVDYDVEPGAAPKQPNPADNK